MPTSQVVWLISGLPQGLWLSGWVSVFVFEISPMDFCAATISPNSLQEADKENTADSLWGTPGACLLSRSIYQVCKSCLPLCFSSTNGTGSLCPHCLAQAGLSHRSPSVASLGSLSQSPASSPRFSCPWAQPGQPQSTPHLLQPTLHDFWSSSYANMMSCRGTFRSNLLFCVCTWIYAPQHIWR